MASCVYIRKVVDPLLMIVSGVLLTVVMIRVRPVRRGFFCDDDSIRYPYRDNTVTGTMLFVGCIVSPHIVMFITELLAMERIRRKAMKVHDQRELHFQDHDINKPPTQQSGADSSHTSLRRTCVAALYNACKLYALFWFGMTMTMAITEAGKLSSGRLRPHFIDVCRPTNYNCSVGYVTEYHCSNNATSMVMQGRKSFPSGHASLSTFVALFLALHIHRRLPRSLHCGLFIKPCLQVCLAVGAFYVCLSRITDNWHHFTDVAVGGVIGVLVAIWMMTSLQKKIGYKSLTHDVVTTV